MSARGRRLASIGVLALSAGGYGCLGGGFSQSGGGPGGDNSAAEAAAKQRFESEVQPMLMSSCLACHASVAGVGPGFLAGAPDVYTTVRGWPNLVVGGNPASSRLYAYATSSSHARVGVNLTDGQADIVRRWIEIVPESTDGGEDPGAQTPLYTPLEGANTIDLSGVGSGLAGASITFNADQLSAGLLLTQVTAVAGAGGLHIKHPLFTTWCDDQGVPVNSFEGLDFTVEPNMSAPLGPGTLSLSTFRRGCKISLSFETLEPSTGGPGGVDGGGGPLGGGCKAVASFTSNARGQIENRCGSCHANAGNPAHNAWDETTIGDLSADGQAQACGQALGNVNLATPDMSSLFNRVRPGQATGHPLTLNTGDFNTFQAAILAWVANEM